jgi:hypothetical protein
MLVNQQVHIHVQNIWKLKREHNPNQNKTEQPSHTYISELSGKQRKKSKNMIYNKQSQRGNMLPSMTSHAKPNNLVSNNG